MIRNIVRTENKEIAKAKPASPFLPSHLIAWGAVGVASLAATAAAGAGSELGAQLALPFGLAATVFGYLAGNAVPKNLQVCGCLDAWATSLSSHVLCLCANLPGEHGGRALEPAGARG